MDTKNIILSLGVSLYSNSYYAIDKTSIYNAFLNFFCYSINYGQIAGDM